MKEELLRMPFFADAPPAVLHFALPLARQRNLTAGEYLMHEGDPADWFFFLISGILSIEIHMHHQGAVVLETLGKGDAVGWSWAMDRAGYRFDGKARTALEAIALPADLLREQCNKDHEFGYHFMRGLLTVVSRRLEATRIRILDIYGSPEQ